MFIIAEFTQKIADLKHRAVQAFSAAGLEFTVIDNDTETIRLVFAGQWGAGKSSILKMLTSRNDIAIGADITTQKAHTYEWEGLEVVDTPGIHTQLRPDHDDISYEAIASADMLVFVITNELFDSHLAVHFRKLAIDKDKAGEMILVVNKMERTSEGNTAEQQDVIREDIKKVIEPYTPEQLYLCFLDANSYFVSLEERANAPEYADDLLTCSGYADFVDTLNRFVKEKRRLSKITTGLYLLEEQLQKAICLLEPKSSDTDINALEENFMQQRHVLIEARSRLQQEVKDIFTSATATIRNIGLDSANLLFEGCKQDEVEQELSNYIHRADDIIERCQQDAKQTITSRLYEIDHALEVIENSEFTKELKSRLSGKFDGLQDNIKKILGSAAPGMKKASQAVINNAYKAGSQGGLKLSNFSGSTVHNIVLKAGRSIGYKFKPWQAIKLTKGIAIGGQVLGVVGVGLSIFMQIKADRDDDRIREDLKNNRQNIRSQFNTAANELEDYGRLFIRDNVTLALEGSIQGIDSNIREIRGSRANRSITCRKMEDLHNECQTLIQNIHNL